MSKIYKREPNTKNQRTRIVAENRLCFSCLKGSHQFRNCPNPRKCKHSGCTSSHNSLLHGADRIFPRNILKKGNKANNAPSTHSSSSVTVGGKNELPSQSSSSSFPSVSDVKCLLQVKQVELISPLMRKQKFLRYVIPQVVIHGFQTLQLNVLSLRVKVSD